VFSSLLSGYFEGLRLMLVIAGAVLIYQYSYDDHRPFDHQLPEV
jgi:hypothetical protein